MLKSIKLTKSSAIYILLIFAPIAAGLEFAHADHMVLFVVSAIALIPLAKLIGDSTEHLATHYGPTAGSLLNVTFGNAAEIIIAVVAISAGLLDLVKASIIFLAIIGLAVPTILASTILSPLENQGQVQLLSDALAFILMVVYILGIVFTFITHKHLFTPPETAEDIQQSHGTHWSKKKSFLFLAASMAGVIVVSEILIASVETTGEELGFGQLFVGAIIVGIVGNAAEHSSAILLARKGKMELSIGIAAGSGTQIALFVVPILVFAGIAMGQPFTLVFTLLEIATIFLAAIILNLIVHDGRSNWFEGAMLTAVYIIIAIAFFFAAD